MEELIPLFSPPGGRAPGVDAILSRMAGVVSAPALEIGGPPSSKRSFPKRPPHSWRCRSRRSITQSRVALGRIRTFFGADRCALVSVTPDGRAGRLPTRRTPRASRVPATLDLAAILPWARDRLLRDRLPVVIPRVSATPPRRRRSRHLGMDVHEVDPDGPHRHRTAADPSARDALGQGGARLQRAACRPAPHVRRGVRQRPRAPARVRGPPLERGAAESRRSRGALRALGSGLSAGRVWVTPETRRIYGLNPHSDQTTPDQFLSVWSSRAPRHRGQVADVIAHGGNLFDETYRIGGTAGSGGSERPAGRMAPADCSAPRWT